MHRVLLLAGGLLAFGGRVVQAIPGPPFGWPGFDPLGITDENRRPGPDGLPWEIEYPGIYCKYPHFPNETFIRRTPGGSALNLFTAIGDARKQIDWWQSDLMLIKPGERHIACKYETFLEVDFDHEGFTGILVHSKYVEDHPIRMTDLTRVLDKILTQCWRAPHGKPPDYELNVDDYFDEIEGWGWVESGKVAVFVQKCYECENRCGSIKRKKWLETTKNGIPYMCGCDVGDERGSW